jgi:hypothetical protein
LIHCQSPQRINSGFYTTRSDQSICFSSPLSLFSVYLLSQSSTGLLCGLCFFVGLFSAGIIPNCEGPRNSQPIRIAAHRVILTRHICRSPRHTQNSKDNGSLNSPTKEGWKIQKRDHPPHHGQTGQCATLSRRPTARPRQPMATETNSLKTSETGNLRLPLSSPLFPLHPHLHITTRFKD